MVVGRLQSFGPVALEGPWQSDGIEGGGDDDMCDKSDRNENEMSDKDDKVKWQHVSQM